MGEGRSWRATKIRAAKRSFRSLRGRSLRTGEFFIRATVLSPRRGPRTRSKNFDRKGTPARFSFPRSPFSVRSSRFRLEKRQTLQSRCAIRRFSVATRMVSHPTNKSSSKLAKLAKLKTRRKQRKRNVALAIDQFSRPIVRSLPPDISRAARGRTARNPWELRHRRQFPPRARPATSCGRTCVENGVSTARVRARAYVCVCAHVDLNARAHSRRVTRNYAPIAGARSRFPRAKSPPFSAALAKLAPEGSGTSHV